MQTKVSQFGQLLATHLQAANMSGGRLAKLTDLSRATVYNWTGGRSPYPRNRCDVMRIAEVLTLSLAQTNELLKAAGFPPNDSQPLDPPQTSAPSNPNATRQPLTQFTQLTTVVGGERAKSYVVERLSTPSAQPFVCIEGMGGIGKTTLALSVIEELERRQLFDTVLWVSAKQEQMAPHGQIEPLADSAATLDDVVTRLTEQMGQQQWAGLSAHEQLERLQPIFKHKPHLIVIDNLETMSDANLLLPALSQLGTTTRILLTSRQSLQRFSYVCCYKVQPLSLADSERLIEAEIGRIGATVVVEDEQMAQLLNLVGGLPLALKLVASQLSYLPLSVVVQNFVNHNPISPTQIYGYIYTTVWQQLSGLAKQLLLSFVDVSAEGETFSWVQMMSGLSAAQCATVIRELRDHSLLEISGQRVNELRYSLHRLTVTFLETQILADSPRWQQHGVARQHGNLQHLAAWLDRTPSEKIASHLPSILTLFEHCQSNELFHAQLAHLIAALHPWPVRWGNWKRWQQHLIFASDYYGGAGDVYQQQLYRFYAAKLSLRLGNTLEAVATCEAIEQLATANKWLTLNAMAGDLHVESLHTLGQLGEARAVLHRLQAQVGVAIDEAVDSAETLTARVNLAWQRIHFLHLDGCVQEAVNLGQQVVEQLARFPEIDKAIVAKSYDRYGVALWALGDYPAALDAITHAHDVYQSIGDRIEATVKQDNIGLVYWSMGQLDKAETAMQESLAAMREINAQWHIVRLIGNLGVVYMAKGEIAQAISYLKESNRLAQLSNDQHEIFRSQANLLTMRWCQSCYTEFIAFNEPLAQKEEISQVTRITVMVELSDAYLDLGDREQACHYIAQAQQLLANIDAICADIFVLRGLAHYERGSAFGRNCLERARQLATSSNRLLDVAACNLDLIPFVETEREKQRCWAAAEQVLGDMSATAWLRGRSIDDVPRLPYLY